MSPRLKSFATDWKSYVALLGVASAAITAFSDAFAKLQKAIAPLKDLPPQAKWIAAGLLALFALGAAVAAWSRRSLLLQPDRFIVSADDPDQLIGRTAEVHQLARVCEAHPLVFLTGESGAGKSALARAGLVPFLRQPAGSRPLLPVVLDASSLSWKDGLRVELSRALARLTPEEAAALGATEPLGADEVFARLGVLPLQARRRLLLILDQVDDYLIAHRGVMFDGHTALTPAQLCAANPDWQALAGLVQGGRLHLLLICRNDIFDRLDSFRFADVRTFSVGRIDRQLISPLLDQVTKDDGLGPVVENPGYGWGQLKRRLLRDLSTDTEHILPIQLAIALDSLQRFRYLTLGEYARRGGARGLERLHIQRHLTEAAHSHRLDETALLRGLMLLVTERGQKTQRATREAFTEAVLGKAAAGSGLGPVIEHFERWRILRRQSSDEGEYLLLHHDYLARGIWEAHRQANQWIELLRQRSREAKDALTFLQHWRALLPPLAQLQLLCSRLRGRFHFGEHASFARWSLLRFLPYCAAIALLWLGARWVDVMQQEKFAEGAFVSLGDSPDTMNESEAADWAILSGAKEDARCRAAQRGLARPVVAEKLSQKPEILSHTVVGLDPTGKLSRRFSQEIVLPTIRQKGTTRPAVIGIACAAHLRLGPKEWEALGAALVERMRAEKKSDELASLGAALGSLSGKLQDRDVRPAAAALVERMKTETSSNELASLGAALGSLSGKLQDSDVRPAAAALVERMNAENFSNDLALLGEALGSLSGMLQASDVRPAAAALVKRMKTEDRSYHIASLEAAFSSLSGKLEASEVQPVADAWLERMRAGNDSSGLDLEETLGRVCQKLEPSEAQRIAAALVEEMEIEKNFYLLDSLGRVLGSLSGKLQARDVQPLTTALVERMKIEQNRHALGALGRALEILSRKLQASDVQPLASVLVERMKTERDSDVLASLGEALGHLSGKLQDSDVRPTAIALVERMKTEIFSDSLASLGAALGSLSGKLQDSDVQPAAGKLVERVKTEEFRDNLKPLGLALASLSGHLRMQDAQLGLDLLTGWCRKGVCDSETAGAWVRLEAVADRDLDVSKRIQKHVDLLALPLVCGEARKPLVDSLEKLTGAKFDGHLWAFVEWATTTDRGKAMHLNLDQRGH